MSALKNARHERFAQELAKGKSQTDAYQAAGYRPSRSAAARLAADVNICARVSEIAERVSIQTALTAADLTKRLMRIADVAEQTGITLDEAGDATASSSKHLGVARAAIMDAAKLNGLIIDKAESTEAGSLTVTYVTSASGPAPAPSDEDYETEA
jgi:phage terminase small subunit